MLISPLSGALDIKQYAIWSMRLGIRTLSIYHDFIVICHLFTYSHYDILEWGILTRGRGTQRHHCGYWNLRLWDDWRQHIGDDY